MLRVMLGLLLATPLFAKDLVVFTTPHLAGKGGLASYYASYHEEHRQSPNFKRKYPHLSRARLRFVSFNHAGHIRRALMGGSKPDLVWGVLDYEVEEMRKKHLIDGPLTVFAESPLTMMANTTIAHPRHSIRAMCPSAQEIIVPHHRLSIQGRDMRYLLQKVCESSSVIRYTHSWSSAYAQFLYANVPYVVSYASSALFHQKSQDFPLGKYTPLVFDEGHIFHRYVAAAVRESKLSQEFMSFIIQSDHHKAIQDLFFMYPLNSSPREFNENEGFREQLAQNYTHHMHEQDRGPAALHLLFLALLTAIFALSAGVIIIILGMFVGVCSLFVSPPIRLIGAVILGGAITLPQIILIPVLQSICSNLEGWQWVSVYEIWYGAAFIGVTLMARNAHFPASLLLQSRQLNFSFYQFVRYVYVPHTMESSKALLYSVPLILFGVCGSFMFTTPQNYPSLSMYLLESSQSGAGWLSSSMTLLPYILVASLVLLVEQRMTTNQAGNDSSPLPGGRLPNLMMIGVVCVYLVPVLKTVPISFTSFSHSIMRCFRHEILETVIFSLGGACVSALFAMLVLFFISMLSVRFGVRLKYMLGLAIFGLIAPRFLWLTSNSYALFSFLISQTVLGVAAMLWLNASTLERVRLRYIHLVRMNRLSLADQVRGVLFPELLLPFVQTAVLTSIIVLNEFVVANAYALTSPITLTRHIYMMLQRYNYEGAMQGGFALLLINTVLLLVYALLNQKRKNK